MGTKPDDIEREIKEQRDLISQHVYSIRDRVQHEVGGTRDEVQDAAARSVSNLGQFKLSEQVSHRPLSSLLGAFGVGIALGAATERKHEPQSQRRYSGSQDGDVGSMFEELLSTIAGSFQSEIRGLISDIFDDLKSKATEATSPAPSGNGQYSRVGVEGV